MELDESTDRNRDRWRCSVVVRACREEGTTGEKGRQKKQNADNTPQHHKGTGQKKNEWLGPRDSPRGLGQHGRRHRSEGRGREGSDPC